MRKYKEYYFRKNKDWYTYDPIENEITLSENAPEEAKKSFEEYLKDKEYMLKLESGLIDINGNELNNDEESEMATKLFGV